MEQAKIPERYTLIEEVGQGGMAVVYRAHDDDPEARGRDQGAAPAPGRRARVEGAPRARGAGRRQAAPREHPGDLRLLGPRLAERVHRHRVHRRPDAEAVPDRARRCASRSRGADRHRGVRRAGARARRRHPPPRREARERHDPEGRPAEADGLRHRAGPRPGADDRHRPAARLAGVHGAGARRGQAARLPHRRVLGRHHAVPAGDGQPAVLGQEPARGAAPHHRGQVPRPAPGRTRRRSGAVAHHLEGAGAPARGPLLRRRPAGRRAARVPERRGAGRRARRAARVLRRPEGVRGGAAEAARGVADGSRVAPPVGEAVGEGAGAVEPRPGIRPEERRRRGRAAPPGRTRAAEDGRGRRSRSPRSSLAAAGSSRRSWPPGRARWPRPVPTAPQPGAAQRRPRQRGVAAGCQRARGDDPRPRARRAAEADRVRGAPRARARTPPAAAAPPVSTEPVPTRTFTLGPTPQNVDVYLDGQRHSGTTWTTRRSPCPGQACTTSNSEARRTAASPSASWSGPNSRCRPIRSSRGG